MFDSHFLLTVRDCISAGIYGMNFSSTCQSSTGGSAIRWLGVMALTSTVLYLMFKKKDWL